MRTINQIKSGEACRLRFMLNRDGKEKALKFAKVTYSTYRKALLDRTKYASLKEFKLEFVISCVVFREFIEEQK